MLIRPGDVAGTTTGEGGGVSCRGSLYKVIESIYTVIEWGLEPVVCNDDKTSPELMSEGRLSAVGSAATRRPAMPNA